MSLSRVVVSPDVFFVCTSHAFTTEKEEIMGLLLGDTAAFPSERSVVSEIWGVHMMKRSHKTKDRVEISPEQLAEASACAEVLSETVGRRTRVVGWYHSHPHITVRPSHVDVATQANYQMLDNSFVGLIFSCFNHDATTKKGRLQLIAFQSLNTGAKIEEIDVPVTISHIVTPHPVPVLHQLVKLQVNMQEEERTAYIASLVQPPTKPANAAPLARLHSSAVYQKSLCRLLEYGYGPLLQTLQEQVQRNNKTIEQLQLQLQQDQQ
eukprot:TRINITY_DN2002_c0_g1_i1.p1 TRINITY_DN2002_c0_g1~~TRINITY_DN2002_c0_g1_i1.p1  ORF type:complete len:265 (-),score=66.49 TRINITY_DN2002_c0_g1_i1:76-870(-)